MEVDAVTREWIRNRSDELAAAAGYRFDPERGQYVVDWIERYCHLYEGEFAGQSFILQGWQREVVMRLFGWVRHSDKWGREVRRFRRGSLWVPKKNGKSPTLAAIGLYLLCGDGEQGQKIYSVAKDGKQAMIAHTHAIEMVRRSPELSAECTINKSTGQITHEVSRSFYRVVAGDNPNSQEGLNGSAMVDETHVVDSRLMRILRGAGISRSEPLQLEVSTAGKNPDSYGKKQFDYGLSVESGEVTDHQFFFQSFNAPQGLLDSEFDSDPARYGEAANPSWGYIIDKDEFLAEYGTSRRNLGDLADFKMYRLNIWQQSASPWIRMSDWDECRQEFDIDFLKGMECIIGLDLSKTRDMTAAVALFRHGDGWYVWPQFWLPREMVRMNAHLAPLAEWERGGSLRVTSGNDGKVLDYADVEAVILDWCGRFNVTQLAYDPIFADDITGRIADATGVERVVFPQKPVVIGPAAEEFQRAIESHSLWHPGNPILTWQIGHTQVHINPMTRLKRPMKPDGKDSVLKIDGVMATIMAMGVATTADDSGGMTVYERQSRGFVEIG